MPDFKDYIKARAIKQNPNGEDLANILDSENNFSVAKAPLSSLREAIFGESLVLYGDLTNKQTEPHNALGELAIDMQLFRDAPTQVAGGISSFAIGRSNTASEYSSVAIGGYNTASGQFSVAMGGYNTASGQFSVAMGLGNTASGQFSVAMGDSNTASKSVSVAMGRNNMADGYSSVAMGADNTANGAFSVAMSEGNTARGKYSTVIGGFSTDDGGAVNGTYPTDHLFKIGNGTNGSSRSNAYVLLRNGTPIYPSLPTADPNIPGALWNNAGVVNVSVG